MSKKSRQEKKRESEPVGNPNLRLFKGKKSRIEKAVLIFVIVSLAIEFGFALYLHFDQPYTGVWIEEVFDYYHYEAEGENRTRLWTVGPPGKFAIRGTHEFTIGYGYWIEGKMIRRNFIDPELILEQPRPFDFRGYPIPEYELLQRELNIERGTEK